MEGKFAPWLGEVLELEDDTVDQIYYAAFSCTGCRRCMTFCPFGIDTQMIMSIAKAETMDSTHANFDQAVRNLTPEVRERWPEDSGRDAVSVAAEGADVLYVALAGKHSIIPAAAIMNAAGEKDFRMKSSRAKADQVKASGAAIICTACENCHSQLSDLNEHYGLGMKVGSLSSLAANALVSTRKT